MSRYSQGRAKIALLAAVLVAGTSSADPSDIMERVAKRESENLASVDIVVKRYQGAGMPMEIEGAGDCAAPGVNCQTYKKEEITGADGGDLNILRILTRTEVAVLAGLPVDSAGMYAYGMAMKAGQVTLNNMIRSSLPLGAGAVLAQMESEEGTTGSNEFANPMTMFGAGGDFAMAGGAAIGGATASLQDGAATAQAEFNAKSELMQYATLGDIQLVEERPGQRLDFNDVNQTMHSEGGQDFVMNNATVWVDTEYEAILRHRMEGTVEDGGEARQFFIETTYSDFRNVDGENWFEPHKTVMRMGGVMSPKELEQLEEAREQLAEFDAQLAAMPADQRAMVEGMMGGQMESVRSMANDGVMQHVQIIEEIYFNPDLNALFRVNPTGAP